MQMEHLGCESPAMVRKEVYAHMIAYNLIRDLIMHTSIIYNTSPTRLSHKGAVQALNAFAEKLNPDSNNIEAFGNGFAGTGIDASVGDGILDHFRLALGIDPPQLTTVVVVTGREIQCAADVC